jgi:ABC-type polysaccharide/polyol phosphate export permease
MKFMDKPYRNLIREVAYSQYAVRDQNSILGILWSFLNPLLIMAVLFAYFRLNAGRDVKHYTVFLLLGVIHYTHFSNSTSAAMNILTTMTQLTRHTILPKEVLVIGSVLSTSVEFVALMLVSVALACLTGVPPSWAMLGLPLIILLQLLFVMWVSLLLAAARVFVKDLHHIYQVLLRILFFATPIFYATAFLKNPLAGLMGLSRRSMIEGQMLSPWVFLTLAAIHAVALWGSFRWFKRCEPSFAEYA